MPSKQSSQPVVPEVILVSANSSRYAEWRCRLQLRLVRAVLIGLTQRLLRGKHLLGSAVSYVLFNGVAAAINLVLALVLTHLLRPYDYGIIAILQAISFAIGLLLNTLTASIARQYFRLNASKFSEYIANCILLAGALLVSVAIVLAPFESIFRSATS